MLDSLRVPILGKRVSSATWKWTTLDMCIPSEVRRDLLRDFLRFDHASEDAMPNKATTTPTMPMIASVDNWPASDLVSIVFRWSMFVRDRVGIA